MRAAIFDPYLDTGGGGERYILTVADILTRNGFEVDIQWRDKKILDWLSTRTGRVYSKMNIVPTISRGLGYDLVFWLSDGSIPFLFSKKNLIHFQTPFNHISGNNILNKLKLLKIDKIICNSVFTKNVIDKEFGVDSVVLYPPISTTEFSSGLKENIILYVGRFSLLQQSKRQDVLIDAFKRLKINNWKLILAGGSEIGSGNFVEDLRKKAEETNIEILENLSFLEIKKLYSKSKIFWSAAGFGVDEEESPQKVEHFGMSLVEAMASGLVPLVTNKGGHKEIIDNDKNGLFWGDEGELVRFTEELINDERRMKVLAQKAQDDSEKFSEQRFEKELLAIIK